MGNTSSEITNSIKAQADSKNGPEIYKLISVAGDGVLIDLMKKAMSTRNYKELDEAILKCEKLLYNKGKGKYIPIEKIVKKRMGESVKEDKSAETIANNPSADSAVASLVPKITSEMSTTVQNQASSDNLKFVCFDLEQRGAVGESLIHLCMLNGTNVHNELAKRLIKHFPNMVNDIYQNEEYYGENALHMAIVNEDPAMVKFLLVNGADVNQPCCGKFFTPEDQKSGIENSFTQERPNLPVDTNYMGYSYFGEFALSFAAILNQEECIRLLIAKKADPNKQDSNGNTVMHMLVINDNLKMFKFMLQFDVDLTIKNRQQLTPLTLAAKLARKEMFQFIMRKTRDINFIYGDIACASYNLRTLDTISDDGKVDINSALYLISYGETEEHLELFDEILMDLLMKKWTCYIKYIFLWDFLVYFIYMAINGTTLIMKRFYFDSLNSSSCIQHASTYTKLDENCKCVYLYPKDDARYTRTIFEIIAILYTIAYIIITVYEFFTQGVRLYLRTLLFNPTKILFLISLVCTMLLIPMRLTCNYHGEDYLTVLAMILQSTYVLYLGRGFRLITTFVYVIHKIIKTNVVIFFAIFFVFIMAFSQAFYMVYDFGDPPVKEVFTNPLQSLMDVLVMSVRILLAAYTYLLMTDYAVVGRILFVVYLVLVAILLINLLIAMMTNTYDHTSELKTEWIRQWARQVLSIENNINAKHKLKQQMKYTNILPNGEKALIIRWRMKSQERTKLLGQVEKFRDSAKLIEHNDTLNVTDEIDKS